MVHDDRPIGSVGTVAGFKKRGKIDDEEKEGGGSGYSAGNLCSDSSEVLSWSDVDH
jgi:hypothetical protein